MKRTNEIRVCFHFSAPALCNVSKSLPLCGLPHVRKKELNQVFVKRPFSSNYDPKVNIITAAFPVLRAQQPGLSP